MNPMTMNCDVASTCFQELIQRIELLERSNRRLKRHGAAIGLCIACVFAIGWQAAPKDPKRITADEIFAKSIVADEFIVHNAGNGAEIRLDRKGLLMRSPALHTINRSKITEYENRIMIGFDEEWTQENLYQPTPHIAVGRWAKDTSDNVVTRISNVSPEGMHSGEWHTNNERSDGRTDKDLIDAIRK